jgi:hypothetical protein
MPPRGGLEQGEGPPETEQPQPFEGDLEELLRESPPANPFVRERWQEQELLRDDEVGPGGGTPGEIEKQQEESDSEPGE